LSCRTGKDFQVPLPKAKNLVEISNSQLSLECSLEFKNYIMIAMEGIRNIRMEEKFYLSEEILD
jgi:hypothetical protein